MKHEADEDVMEHEAMSTIELAGGSSSRAAAEREFAARQELDLPIMDEEDAVRRQCHEEKLELVHRFHKTLLLLHPHAKMQVECVAFVWRSGHLFDIRDQKDIAVRHGNGPEAKANVNKYVQEFRRQLGLPPTENQRKVSATAAMHHARNQQLVSQSQSKS